MLRFLILLSWSVFALVGCGDGPPSSSVAGAPQGGDFVLQTTTGPLDSKSLRGKVLLIFFGYSQCPDICPASMAAGAQALNALNAQERANTRLIMISVDPERDTVQALKDYVAYFHPEMLGATGTPEQIAAVAKAYGAGYVRHPADKDGHYAVDHTSNTYIVAPDGKLAAILPLGTPTVEVVTAIRKQLP